MKSGIAKKLLVMVLALLMALGTAGGVLAKGKDDDRGGGKGKENKGKKIEIRMEFDDVQMEWARKHIASLAAQQIFEGYDDGTFRPNKPVTRLEAIVTAVRLMGLREQAESAEKKASHLNLKDEKQIASWARGYVAVALENDLFFENETKLQPNKAADRLWVTTLLVKALDLDDEARKKMNTNLDFRDKNAIPAGSVGFVAVAVEHGIVLGYPDGTFRPNRPVTRAEIAAFLDRAGMYLPDNGLLRGTLKAPVTNNTLLLTNGISYPVDPGAFVYRNGSRIALSDLKAGESIVFRTYNQVVIFIEVTGQAPGGENPAPFKVTGTLAAVNGKNVTLRLENGAEVTYRLDEQAVIKRNGVKVDASALVVGDKVTAHISAAGAIVSLEATGQSVNANLTGTLASEVKNNVLSVFSGGKLVQYALRSDADIYRNNEKVSASALKQGDEVFVRVENSLVELVTVTKTAEQSTVFTGTVKMVATDDQVLLVTVNGADTAYLVEAGTKIYRGGSQVALSQLKPGDVIFAKAKKDSITLEFVQVTEQAEQREMTVSGWYNGMTFNNEGKISTISIIQETGGAPQTVVYQVAKDVKISGSQTLLVQNHPIELKIKNQLVTEIIIK